MKTKICTSFALIVLLVNTALTQNSLQERNFDFTRRNSIYFQNYLIFPALYYDRIIPVHEHFGIIPKLGIEFGLGYGDILLFETSVFTGGKNHNAEIGVGYRTDGAIIIPINYRYMGINGFLLKAGYGFATSVLKSSLFVGIGYSF